MTTLDAFLKFKSNLELPDKTFSEAAKLQEAIRAKLDDHLTIYDSFLSGSYARYTKIDPLKDIDIILVRNNSRVAVTSGGGITPDKALNEVVGAVRKALPNAQISVQSRSVNIELTGIKFGFDLVPVWLRTGDGYWIPDTDTGGWIPTDPVQHGQLMTSANQATDGRLKPIVKMMKHWNANNLNLLRSFHVELLCRDILLHTQPQSFPSGVATVLHYLPHLVGEQYLDPVYQASQINRSLSSEELATLVSRLNLDAAESKVALDLEAWGRHDEAIKKWETIFITGF